LVHAIVPPYTRGDLRGVRLEKPTMKAENAFFVATKALRFPW
jgi:hypothetical protein